MADHEDPNPAVYVTAKLREKHLVKRSSGGKMHSTITCHTMWGREHDELVTISLHDAVLLGFTACKVCPWHLPQVRRANII